MSWFGGQTRVDRENYGGAHWRHLVNTTERSVYAGDAALCQITLTNCWLFNDLDDVCYVSERIQNNCYKPEARFTKYLKTILRLSYDNAKVTIDLRRTSNLQNISRERKAFLGYDFTCSVVRSSETVFVNKLAIFVGKSLARCKSLS